MPIVADNIETLILNVKLRQDFPLELAQQLDVLKEASQEAGEDIVTDFTFADERLFIKPHGAGNQWRWILHSPSLHLDVGLGKHTQIVTNARLSAAYLWATEIGDALRAMEAELSAYFDAKGAQPKMRDAIMSEFGKALAPFLSPTEAYVREMRQELATGMANIASAANLATHETSGQGTWPVIHGWTRGSSIRVIAKGR